MVIDTLSNSDKYESLHPHFSKAFAFIKSQQPDAFEVGKYPIDGPGLHAAVSLKEGTTREAAKFEAHDLNIDIQVCLSGKEQMGWSARERVSSPKEAYNAEKDVTFFADIPETYFTLQAGQFAIFFPEDVHAPMIGEGPIKKLVVKISK